MLYLAIFLIILLIILIMALFTKARILLEFVRDGKDDYFLLSLHILGGLINYKYEVPLLNLEKDGVKIVKVKEKRRAKEYDEKTEGRLDFSNIYEKIRMVIKTIDKYDDLICDIRKYLRGKLVLENLEFEIAAGFGDAFFTGILNGLIWTAVGILTSYVLNNVKNIEKHINVKSDFNNKKFNIDLHCIFNVRIVHIIVVRLKIMKVKKKSIKSKETIGGGVSG